MQSGLPRISAGVLTCLLTTDAGGVTAAELAQRLEVSPASVSKSISFLEGQGLVRREPGEGRRERYVADNDAWYGSIVSTARSNAQLAETARQGVAVLGRATPAGERLESIARFMDFISESLMRAAAQARDILHTKVETRSEGPS
nr:MarR family transcriptional regulator [Promicromonospora iranensis]